MPGTHIVDFTRVFDVQSFRHTYASLMLAVGFPPYEVSRWLGHASLATTDSIYAHMYPSDYASHVDRFEVFIQEATISSGRRLSDSQGKAPLR
jgi:hypothetical protein